MGHDLEGDKPVKGSSGRDFVTAIADREEEASKWYIDVVLKAELADYSPVRGCMIIRPYGYALWESIQEDLDRRFKATGVQNAYFPLFIPGDMFQREAEHVEGFDPEVAWVTRAGRDDLAEPLVVRPTSEIIIGNAYAKWIQSYRDLPVLINQWANVVRWEMRTLPFLRTTEFLWQEGHTAHRDEGEARERAMMMLKVYEDFLREHLAIPVVAGTKSELEKFPGAVDTWSVEAMMADGRALQAGTSHYLGDGFARVLDIDFLDDDGERKFVHTTSWGVSTRLIGGLIMVHGDERGLVLPPTVAPYQVVIVPIAPGDTRDKVIPAARELRDRLVKAGHRVHLDDRPEQTPGWKFNEWELKGVPVRVEIGPRDLEAGQVMAVRRDDGSKEAVPSSGVEERIGALLEEVQQSLYDRAYKRTRDDARPVANMDELKRVITERTGFAIMHWCGRDACEEAVKDETGATIRCIPLEGGEPEAGAACLNCGEPARHRTYTARAY